MEQMTTYCLRFPDQASWKEKAAEVGIRTNSFIPIEEESIDSDTGEVVTPPAPMEGWHINFKADSLPSSFESYLVSPQSPYRKFAGD